jgi:hypothetical protein
MKRSTIQKRSKSRRTNKNSKRHNKWIQRGCRNQRTRQKGGNGILAGHAWAASHVKPYLVQTGGNVLLNPNGNHYALNTNISPVPLASNALVEMAEKITVGGGGGGGRRRRNNKYTNRNRKNKMNLGGQNGGGITEYLPMNASNVIRSMGDTMGGFIHGLQGDSTPYNYSTPTIQPIANTTPLK